MQFRAVFVLVLQKEDCCWLALTFMIQPGTQSAKTCTLMDQNFCAWERVSRTMKTRWAQRERKSGTEFKSVAHPRKNGLTCPLENTPNSSHRPYLPDRALETRVPAKAQSLVNCFFGQSPVWDHHWCNFELEVLKIAEVLCLTGNGRLFYVPESRQSYHP